MNTPPTRLGLTLLVVTLLVGAVTAWWYSQNGAEDPAGLTVYGNVEIRTADLAFIETERVLEVLVEEGSEVQQGQVLARQQQDRLQSQLAEARALTAAQSAVLRRLTSGTRQQQIEQAAAEVEAAQTRLDNADRRVQRLRDTSGSGASSEQDLDDALANLQVARSELNVRRQSLDLAREGPREEEIAEARARLEAVRARIELLEQRLADATLRAPSAGVIQSRLLEPGEMAGPARPAFVLALNRPKWIRAYLPEPQLGRIRPGMPARVISDSFPGQEVAGRVGFISPEAEFTPKNVQTTELRSMLVYEVRIRVEDEGNRLRLGMPVTVRIDDGRDSPTSSADTTTMDRLAQSSP